MRCIRLSILSDSYVVVHSDYTKFLYLECLCWSTLVHQAMLLRLCVVELMNSSSSSFAISLTCVCFIVSLQCVGSVNFTRPSICFVTLTILSRSLGQWRRRIYSLRDSSLYYYRNDFDALPRGVSFLEGCTIDVLADSEKESRGYFGFEVVRACVFVLLDVCSRACL